MDRSLVVPLPTAMEDPALDLDAAFRRYSRYVAAVALRLLGRDDEVDDVVQEVFLAAFRGLRDYRGEARLSTWLHRIAVTRALNHLERAEERASRARVELDDVLEGLPVATESGDSPLQALQAGEMQRRLADCLGRMPAAFRAILARDSQI